MHRDELAELLTPEGLTLLDSLPDYDSIPDVARSVMQLRQAGHSPSLVAAVLTQARLRRRARIKFGEFAKQMLFTEAGLEQATRLNVAAHHAARFRDAGLNHLADLGCGIGGDAMAFSALGLTVTAVERDEVTAAIASYNLAAFPESRVQRGEAESFDASTVDAVFLDPARRTAGHSDTRRLASPEDWSPSLDFVFGLAEQLPVGVKLGPAFARELIPGAAGTPATATTAAHAASVGTAADGSGAPATAVGCEAQWVSVGGSLVETGLWFGSLARPGISRSALVLDADGAHELNASGEAEDTPVGALGDYLYEPDPAVIRAHLIGLLAEKIGARMVSERIAWMTSEAEVRTPFASGFRVLEELPFHERQLKAALRQRGIGTLEIKKRGVDVDPAALRTRLALRGTTSAVLILTRVADHHTALLAKRI